MKAKHPISVPKATSQLRMTFGLAKYFLRALLKNKSSFFFGLIFPIVIVSIFGSFSDGISKTKIGVDSDLTSSNSLYSALKDIAEQNESPIVLVTESEPSLRDQLHNNKVDAVIIKSEGTEVTLLTSNTNPTGAGTAQAFISTIVSNINLQMALSSSQLAPQSLLKVDTEEVSGKTLKAIDFILPGQIGFSLLSVAIFGVAFTFLTLRKTLVLKRIFATNVKPMSFVIAQSLSRSVQGVLQALVLILFGVIAFKFHLVDGFTTLFEIMILSFLGVLTFIGFGIFFANIARDEQTMPIYLNLFNLPQMFLSGVFFNTDLLPAWLAKVGSYLPLSYVNTAMRKITIDGAGMRDILPYLAGMAIWAIFSYIIAAKTFKTE